MSLVGWACGCQHLIKIGRNLKSLGTSEYYIIGGIQN